MHPKDITVFGYYNWPLPQLKNQIIPSARTVSFLTKLLKDEYFQKKVIELREKNKLPQNGYDGKLLIKYKQHNVQFSDVKYNGTYDIEPLWLNMRDDVKEIVNHYHFSRYYIWNFFLLISHNAFIETNIEDLLRIQYFTGLDMIKKVAEVYDEPTSAIIISSKITKVQLKKWIDENWEPLIEADMQMHMLDIPRENGTYINAELDIEIASLKERGFSYNQISEDLSLKYPSNGSVYDIGWLAMRYSRYKKKKLKNISPTTPSK